MAARFRFHDFGERADGRYVACDGLVEGTALHLSHWAGNRTPAEHKRDTSTEIALAFAQTERDALADLGVANNHFDSDGVLSVWALVDPDRAMKHRDRMVAAAEAGDFDEWPDDDGVRLDAAIRALARGAKNDAAAYDRVLPDLEALFGDLSAREDLWMEEWRVLVAAEQAAREGALEVARAGRIALFHHRPGTSEMPGPLLSRLAPAGVDRWLLAFERADGGFDYRYERPRHAWADTVVRPAIPQPSRSRLRQGLDEPDAWAVKGSLGMTGLLRTDRPIRHRPERVADALLAVDR